MKLLICLALAIVFAPVTSGTSSVSVVSDLEACSHSSPLACGGCTKIDENITHAPNTCVVLTSDNFVLTAGSCVPNGPIECTANPCTMSGGFTITNNCEGDVGFKVKVNGGCETQIKVSLNESAGPHWDFGTEVPCGTSMAIIVREGGITGCPSTGNHAMVTWACFACNNPH